MKLQTTLLLSVALGGLSASCSSTVVGEQYDVANPYAAPDYVDENSSPYGPSDVNPAYDSPAVYEEAAVYEEPAASPIAPPVRQGTVHTVVGGDTLWGLGKKYGVSVDAIKAANGLSSDVAVLGAQLQIPAP